MYWKATWGRRANEVVMDHHPIFPTLPFLFSPLKDAFWSKGNVVVAGVQQYIMRQLVASLRFSIETHGKFAFILPPINTSWKSMILKFPEINKW